MNVKEAEKIFNEYGLFLEYSYGRISPFFIRGVPESLLPYPKPILIEVLNIMAEYYYKQGQNRKVKTIEEVLSLLAHFIEDQKAIEMSSELLANKDFQKEIMISIKEYQKDWENLHKN